MPPDIISNAQRVLTIGTGKIGYALGGAFIGAAPIIEIIRYVATELLMQTRMNMHACLLFALCGGAALAFIQYPCYYNSIPTVL